MVARNVLCQLMWQGHHNRRRCSTWGVLLHGCLLLHLTRRQAQLLSMLQFFLLLLRLRLRRSQLLSLAWWMKLFLQLLQLLRLAHLSVLGRSTVAHIAVFVA